MTFERLAQPKIRWRPQREIMQWLKSIEDWRNKMIAKLMYQTGYSTTPPPDRAEIATWFAHASLRASLRREPIDRSGPPSQSSLQSRSSELERIFFGEFLNCGLVYLGEKMLFYRH